MFKVRNTFKTFADLKEYYSSIGDGTPEEGIIPPYAYNGEHYFHRHQWASAWIEKLSIKDVLEVGTTTGEFIVALHQKGLTVTGVEAVPRCYRALQKDVTVCGFDIPLYNNLFEEFEPPRQYECVCAFEVIEHIFNLDVFVKKLKKCLIPGGYFMFSTPSEHGSFGSQNFNDQHLNSATLESVREMFKDWKEIDMQDGDLIVGCFQC